MYDLLIGKIAEQKKLRRLTNRDIGQMCGYQKNSVDAFMCGVRHGKHIASAVAAVFGLEQFIRDDADAVKEE